MEIDQFRWIRDAFMEGYRVGYLRARIDYMPGVAVATRFQDDDVEIAGMFEACERYLKPVLAAAQADVKRRGDDDMRAMGIMIHLSRELSGQKRKAT